MLCLCMRAGRQLCNEAPGSPVPPWSDAQHGAMPVTILSAERALVWEKRSHPGPLGSPSGGGEGGAEERISAAV